jgi:deazaflavin-dependent oxidoreductase (nitroreductase family)
MSFVMNRITRAFTDLHVAVIRVSHGRVGARMGTMKLCVLTTTGRKSGVERHNPLACFPHDEGFVVIASAGGSDQDPAWYRNLVANPDVRLEVDGLDRPMTARTATDQERPLIWSGVIATAKNFAGYQTKTSRTIPVVILAPAQV